MTAKRVVFVAGLPRLSKRTRLAKFAALYEGWGTELEHYAWERNIQDTELPGEPGCKSTVTHFGGGYAERGLGKHYVWWILKTSFRLVSTRPTHVHALGLEGAMAAVPSRVLWGTKILFDDADRFSLCHNFGERTRSVIQIVERAAARLSALHLIPGKERYPDGLPCRETIEVKNTPSAAALKASEGCDPRLDADSFNVLVTGWIGETRGAAFANSVAAALADHLTVRFIAAGRVTGPSAQEFVERGNVDYRGEIPNSEALALCRSSQLVLTLYDPGSTINRFAEPNKWGDCVALETPFLVNSEVETARPYLQAGAAVSVPYADHVAGAETIAGLASNESEVEQMRQALVEIGLRSRSFDEQVGGPLMEWLET